MDKIFGIIQSLCRVGLSGDKELVEYQVGKLADEYKANGDTNEYKTLSLLLRNSKKRKPLESSVISSSATIWGEILNSNTPIPVDKETAAPLLEIFFEDQLPAEGPLFDSPIMEAIDSVILEWKNYGKLLKLKASPSRSCLIYGVPGAGKTFLAKWIAKQVGLPVVLARLDGIVSSFLGTSARNISSLFSFANRYKCVLLLDEFDAIAKLRDDPQEVGEVKRIVNTLLQNMDERDNVGFTIGVTNHEQLLDPAVWRRFDVQIEIPKPTTTVAYNLLIKYLQPIKLDKSELTFLSWCAQDSTGADIEKLSNWIKRVKIISEYKDMSMIDLMRRYVLLNTGRISTKVKNILEGSNEEILKFFKGKELNYKQKDIAEIFNISQSSISKQIAKANKE